MNKSLTIVKAFWQRALTYRFTVLSYRIGEIGEFLALILMWTAIYDGSDTIRGFTLQEMITYILVGNLFYSMVRNFLSTIVARDIKDGRLSMFLVKPINYFHYIISQEIGRISLATIMSILSQAIVIIFFLNIFIWNTDVRYLLLILVMILFAFVIELLLAYLIGLIAFWTVEIAGLHATIDRIKKFFSGGYFPLSLLPLGFIKVSFLLPFAYSFFVPAQLFLKKIDLATSLRGLSVQIIWIILLYGIIQIVWTRGLKKYEGVGI